MSTLKVTVEKLIIHEHPNADALELAQVGLFRAVVAKGVYQTGDYALYIPEQAVLPDPLIEELGLVGKLAGKNKNRVKAIRLRGELSQGIVCRPSRVWEDGTITNDIWGRTSVEQVDFSERLGITKWVPPVPVHMSGQVEPAPGLLRWVEIENIKRYPDIFTPGEPVVATEKIHGTCCLVTYQVEEDRVYVTSKGFGSSNLALVESDRNLYWRAAKKYALGECAKTIAHQLGAQAVGLFGEVFGAGVQDLYYGADSRQNEGIGYRIFDIAVQERDGTRWWMDSTKVMGRSSALGIPMVPVVYQGPYDVDLLTELASGKESVSGSQSHVQEGLVVRAKSERHSPVLGGRAIAKFINPDYLTRKGGTEYE